MRGSSKHSLEGDILSAELGKSFHKVGLGGGGLLTPTPCRKVGPPNKSEANPSAAGKGKRTLGSDAWRSNAFEKGMI